MMPRGSAVSILAAAGCAILTSVGCGDGEPPPETLRPVRTQQVFSTGGVRVRSFSGSARSGTESRLSFRVTGSIVELPVRVGDSVGVGQLIARLDAEDYRLAMREAEAGLAQARAQAQNAESNYERVRELYEADNASRADLDAALAGFQSTEASVRASEQRLQLARQQLSYTRLTAPTTGAVAAVPVEVNENVQAGQVVVYLNSGTDLEVEVGVPGVLISQVTEGDMTEVTFDALPDRAFMATVSEVGVAATGTATTYPVTVVLLDPDPDLRSGMAAEVAFRFESGEGRELFIVPSIAVGEDRGGRFVYVVEPEEGAVAESGVGMIRRRPVRVGEMTTQGFEILEGLSDGEHVVVAGVSRIEDGLRVQFRLPG
jgi:RND family efflux transporter MFP subunit